MSFTITFTIDKVYFIGEHPKCINTSIRLNKVEGRAILSINKTSRNSNHEIKEIHVNPWNLTVLCIK